jgi:curved DNA-binding protein CbpA
MSIQADAPLKSDILKACRILFGPEVSVTQGFLSYIQLSGIKSAYRRVAKLTHPDRARTAEKIKRKRTAGRFIEAKRAYELLASFVRNRDSGATACNPCMEFPDQDDGPVREAGDSGGCTDPGEHYFNGKIPSRELLFGQYLYYSGQVSFDALIKAIVWQRRMRTRIGEIARKRGFLSEAQIRDILYLKRYDEPTGEAFIRLNLISREQLGSLLSAQKRTQRLIGEYFIHNRHLSLFEISNLHNEFLMHNASLNHSP